MNHQQVTLCLNRAATIANVVLSPLFLGWGVFYITTHEPDWLAVAWSAMFILAGLHGFSRMGLRLSVGSDGFTYTGPLARRKTIRWDEVRLVLTRETQNGTTPVRVLLESHLIGPDIQNYASAQLAMPIIARHLPPGKIKDRAEWHASGR